MNDQTPGGDCGALTDSDRKMLKRLLRDEKQRFGTLFSGLLVGGLIVWLNWEAPFAYNELKKLPYSEASRNPYYETIHMIPWMLGMCFIARGIYDCFFNRRRKLLLKLAAMLEPARPPEGSESSEES